MICPKTASIVTSEIFRVHRERVLAAYVSELPDAEKAAFARNGKTKTDVEFPMRVTQVVHGRGVNDFFAAQAVIRRNGDTKNIGKIRHLTSFMALFERYGYLAFALPEPESGKTRTPKQAESAKYAVLTTRLGNALKTFPGKKHVTANAFEDFKKTWLDSVSSVKYALETLDVPVDAIIVSGSLVRAVVARTPCPDLLVIEHLGIAFKSDWNVSRVFPGSAAGAMAKLSVYLGPETLPRKTKMSRVSEVLGTTAKGTLAVLRQSPSPLAAFLIQYLE